MNLTRKIAFNTVAQIITKSIGVLFTIITTILLTGYLGKEGYGNYVYLMTLIVLFGSLADWGTATIGVREMAKETDNQKLVGNVVFVRFLISLIAVIFFIGFAYIFPFKSTNGDFIRQSIVWAGLALFFIANRATLGAIFQSRLEMGKMMLIEILNGFLILLFSWIIIKQQLSPANLFMIISFSGFISLIFGWLLIGRTLKITLNINRQFTVRYLQESLWMGSILLILTVVNKIDTLLLGALKGSDAVAVYGLSYRVYDVLILGAAYLMSSLLPVISQNSQLASRQQLAQIYQRALTVLVVMSVSIFIITWFLAPLFIQVLTQNRFGEFQEAVGVLRILGVALLFAYYNHLTGYTIVALGKQRHYFSIAAIALVLNVFANLIFIPRYSFQGSAWITVITEVLVAVLTTRLIYRLIQIKPAWGQLPASAWQLIQNMVNPSHD